MRAERAAARRLYLPAGYPSMYQYGVQRLHWSGDEAYRRIRVARTLHAHPEILPALADGRLHLNAVSLLAPCLEREDAGALLEVAARRSMAEIERLLAERAPQPDLPVWVTPVESVGRLADRRAAELVP